MGIQDLPYRLKSARRKRRLLIKDRDKQILKLEREVDDLSRARNKVTMEALAEPYQKGWQRLLVLKAAIALSEKAAFYRVLLNKINTIQYHHDPEFKPHRRRKYWYKYNQGKLPELKVISNDCWEHNRYKLTDEEKALFNPVTFWNEQRYNWTVKYEFKYPELFEIAIQPRMITKVKVGDALIEQQYSYANDRLYDGICHHRLYTLNGGRYKNWKSWYYIEKAKYVNPLKNKPKWSWDEE